VENDTEDIEEMRNIMQELLEGNPCADAARLELESGSSTQAETNAAIPRAILILMSDDCQAPEVPPTDDTQAVDLNAEMHQAEENLQDAIDEIMDAEDEGEFFIQVDQAGRFQRFMRGVGVVFLMLFLLLGCVGTVAAIAFFIGVIVATIYLVTYTSTLAIYTATQGWGVVTQVVFGAYGSALTLPFGVVGCAHRIYTTVLPRLNQ
jgi:hypothetical protein